MDILTMNFTERYSTEKKLNVECDEFVWHTQKSQTKKGQAQKVQT